MVVWSSDCDFKRGFSVQIQGPVGGRHLSEGFEALSEEDIVL